MSEETSWNPRLNFAITGSSSDENRSLKSLTVLAEEHDPYRQDTPAHRRNGWWLKKAVDRFLEPHRQIHLRGLHYLISSAGDLDMPNGKPYVNDEECWKWMSEKAAKAARWIGLVPFERIIDERNEPPTICIAEAGFTRSGWSEGESVSIPFGDEGSIYPDYYAYDTTHAARQPYRIIFFGEKTSLKEILLPFAQRVNGELILPTGEASDTLVFDVARRAAADPRQAVVLYFSDFDPSGHQMAISVSRKLQALCDMRFPDLEIQLQPVALTREQVIRLNLPSTPLKETEERGDKWRAAMGYEQVEIDALIALNSEALRQIVSDALEPFFDFSLEQRTRAAVEDWRDEARLIVESHPEYAQARERIAEAYSELSESLDAFAAVQDDQYEILTEIELPELEVIEPEISKDSPEPLFDSSLDFVEATDRLRAHKRWELNGKDHQ